MFEFFICISARLSQPPPLSSLSYVLRKVPAMWDAVKEQYRLGPSKISQVGFEVGDQNIGKSLRWSCGLVAFDMVSKTHLWNMITIVLKAKSEPVCSLL